MIDYSHKVAVVTGGANGIGLSLAKALSARGAHLVVADMEGDKAQQVANDLSQSGPQSIGCLCDVTDPDSVRALAGVTQETFGKVNLLCNNAGVFVPGTLEDTSWQNVQWTFAVNVFGVYHGVMAFLPALREAAKQDGFAHILNTASGTALAVTGRGPKTSAYNGAKHAVLGLSDSLRADLKEDGIGVSILCPGPTNTTVWACETRRPDAFGGKGDARTAEKETLSAVGQNPDDTAAHTLAAIDRGDFYIITNISATKTMMNQSLKQRYDEMIDAVNSGPGSP